MTRNRTCHFGEASIDCIGSPSQSQDCNTQPCGKFKLINTTSTAAETNTLHVVSQNLCISFLIQLQLQLKKDASPVNIVMSLIRSETKTCNTVNNVMIFVNGIYVLRSQKNMKSPSKDLFSRILGRKLFECICF